MDCESCKELTAHGCGTFDSACPVSFLNRGQRWAREWCDPVLVDLLDAGTHCPAGADTSNTGY